MSPRARLAARRRERRIAAIGGRVRSPAPPAARLPIVTTHAALVLAFAACGGNAENTPPLAPPPPPSSAAPAAPAAAQTTATPDAGATPEKAPAKLVGKALPLPGTSNPPASMDYLVYEQAHGRVWVPVANTGSVDVLDIASGAFTRIDGFKSEEREVRGKKRLMGPNAATVGDGVVYIGNRATGEVCAVDSSKLKLGKCLKLPTATDGVSYVASTKEVWVTTPRDQSLTVLDASKPDTLKPKAVIKMEGAPEGYAVDDSRGVFFTNLEDKDRTVEIDLKTRKPKATWKPECGADGPRGVAADIARGFVYVACTDHVVVLDRAHDGALVGRLDTGAGVDNIDWLEARRLLYVGAATAAKLTVARIDDNGRPTVVAEGSSAEGARNGVADSSGNAYLEDPQHAGLLVFPFTLPQ